MGKTSYDTVYTGGVGEIVEKKSRFIAQVFPVKTEEEVMQYLEAARKKYWDARHNCYAFILGADGGISRCSDDGEPSGTAGRPILEVLAKKGLKDVLVIVTRYFGGTLLGTGGLVRAYSQAAQAGLLESCIITKQAGYRITVDTDYNGIGKLQYVLAQLEASVLDTSYTDKVQMVFLVPSALADQARKEVTEATSGQAVITQEKEEVYFAEIEKEVVVFDS
ncbi:YigZ family protein [bacterium D16-51]|nr:YigZ family protein [bacterium D16-59]RKI60924.1 YigZ family protein [bacterium D16-51]